MMQVTVYYKSFSKKGAKVKFTLEQALSPTEGRRDVAVLFL
jgi:hypothetical protein